MRKNYSKNDQWSASVHFTLNFSLTIFFVAGELSFLSITCLARYFKWLVGMVKVNEWIVLFSLHGLVILRQWTAGDAVILECDAKKNEHFLSLEGRHILPIALSFNGRMIFPPMWWKYFRNFLWLWEDDIMRWSMQYLSWSKVILSMSDTWQLTMQSTMKIKKQIE